MWYKRGKEQKGVGKGETPGEVVFFKGFLH
jgi:hypothetical protein